MRSPADCKEEAGYWGQGLFHLKVEELSTVHRLHIEALPSFLQMCRYALALNVLSHPGPLHTIQTGRGRTRGKRVRRAVWMSLAW